MQTVSRGAAIYRTKLMSAAKAAQFARCLSANGSFASVSVVESPRSPGRFYVSYQPSSSVRQAVMVEREATKRAKKAVTEGAHYHFVPDDTHEFMWCLSTSGEVYEVTDRSCSCPDHEFRCRHLGIPCKHQMALSNTDMECVTALLETVGDEDEPGVVAMRDQFLATWQDGGVTQRMLAYVLVYLDDAVRHAPDPRTTHSIRQLAARIRRAAKRLPYSQLPA